jgi:hypothetical protein
MSIYTEAVLALTPNAKFRTTDDKITGWWSEDIEQPTDSAIDTEVIKLQKAYDDLAYSRARQADYPDWGSQLNKIYDDGLTKWKSEMVDPIKAKWPKDNSGPV